MKRRDGKTGTMIMSAPFDFAIRYDDSDISEISYSQKFSCRQNVSDGSEYVCTISTPSTSIMPSVSASVLSLRAEIMLSLSFAIGILLTLDPPAERRKAGWPGRVGEAMEPDRPA